MTQCILIRVTGAETALADFARRHLARREFSFETLRPTPAGLATELPSDVEDAYEALYGDWAPVAARDRFNEVATERGFPFPLASREQVLACHEALVPYGPEALERARRRRRDIDVHGAGDVSGWRRLNWFVEVDAWRTVAFVGTGEASVAFELEGTLSDKLVRLFSLDAPALEFDVLAVAASGRRARRLAMRGGRKRAVDAPTSVGDVLEHIVAFRRQHGLGWLARWMPEALVQCAVAMDAKGHHMLRDTGVSLDFALSRLRAGEAPAALQVRFPEIGDAQVQLLTALQSTLRP